VSFEQVWIAGEREVRAREGIPGPEAGYSAITSDSAKIVKRAGLPGAFAEEAASREAINLYGRVQWPMISGLSN
jgi:hypothetical protein